MSIFYLIGGIAACPISVIFMMIVQATQWQENTFGAMLKKWTDNFIAPVLCLLIIEVFVGLIVYISLN